MFLGGMASTRSNITPINNFCSYSLGKCLDKKQICDGIPDCQDASDEKSEVCLKHIEM